MPFKSKLTARLSLARNSWSLEDETIPNMKNSPLFVFCASILFATLSFGAKRPNILYLYVDDMGWGSIGPNGQDGRKALGKPYVLTPNLDRLAADIEAREQQLQVLESLMANRKLQQEAAIAGRPVTWGWLSSRFGRRTDPFTGRPAWHAGVDFAGKEGSDIISVGSGVVTWAGERYGYGLMVEVNHGGGITTRYGHAKEILVKVGDIVKQGETLAKMGSTGRSTGPHVHFEVRKHGKAVDPSRYVYRKRG